MNWNKQVNIASEVEHDFKSLSQYVLLKIVTNFIFGMRQSQDGLIL